MSKQFMTIKEASEWASKLLHREVTVINISYLIQYGKVKKYGENGMPLISIEDLKKYYDSFNGKREVTWKQKLGKDLNWHLSFDNLGEKDTTKHVHRLHPYKSKFIPQLVEYFIDQHTDEFKKQSYFRKGDIILDPFVGSGTTLVQANELGIHSIGVDVSRFNCLIAETKLLDYDIGLLEKEIRALINSVITYEYNSEVKLFEDELIGVLQNYNSKYFPSPSFKYKINRNEIVEPLDHAERPLIRI